jgi:hypothetical protein
LTGTELLEGLSGRGFRMAAAGNGVRVSPWSRLTGADRDLIRQHKGVLLALLHAQDTEQRLAALHRIFIPEGADLPLWTTIEPALLAKETCGWSADPELRQRQWAASNVIDTVYLAGDLAALRTAVNEFMRLLAEDNTQREKSWGVRAEP